MFAAADHRFMARALQLAERGLFSTTPNPRVGCVIVRDGTVVGEGWHAKAGEAHAEIHALRRAGAAAQGATAYVTLEPCSHHGRTPPCAEALVDAGVARVVAAMTDPNPQVAGQGTQLLTLAGVQVEVGLLADAARELNPGFISRMTRGRPWVRLKTAASLDGKTALESGESKWITGDAARLDGHHWRARACAVVTGSGTVRADDPQLNVRGVATQRQPLKVIVASDLAIPSTARVLEGGALVFCTAAADPGRRLALETAGAEVVAINCGGGRGVDLSAMLTTLARRGINEVHVEAGATLNGALLAAGLVDEWLAYFAPVILGHRARGLFDIPALAAMSARTGCSVHDVRQLGADLRLILRPKPISASIPVDGQITS